MPIPASAGDKPRAPRQQQLALLENQRRWVASMVAKGYKGSGWFGAKERALSLHQQHKLNAVVGGGGGGGVLQQQHHHHHYIPQGPPTMGGGAAGAGEYHRQQHTGGGYANAAGAPPPPRGSASAGGGSAGGGSAGSTHLEPTREFQADLVLPAANTPPGIDDDLLDVLKQHRLGMWVRQLERVGILSLVDLQSVTSDADLPQNMPAPSRRTLLATAKKLNNMQQQQQMQMQLQDTADSMPPPATRQSLASLPSSQLLPPGHPSTIHSAASTSAYPSAAASEVSAYAGMGHASMNVPGFVAGHPSPGPSPTTSPSIAPQASPYPPGYGGQGGHAMGMPPHQQHLSVNGYPVTAGGYPGGPGAQGRLPSMVPPAFHAGGGDIRLGSVAVGVGGAADSNGMPIDDLPLKPPAHGDLDGVDPFTNILASNLQTADSQPQEGDLLFEACGVNCNRRFRADRIDRHREACAKAKAAPRKVFIPKRVAAEAEAAQQKAPPMMEKRESKWRQNHNNFQAIVKGQPLAEPVDDRVGCPHCQRKFAPLVAENHIPSCAERSRRHGGQQAPHPHRRGTNSPPKRSASRNAGARGAPAGGR